MSSTATESVKRNVTSDDVDEPKTKHPMVIVWSMVIFSIFLHVGAFYGIYLAFTSAMWKTLLFAFVLDYLSVLGVIAGIHRLWSHRSYKAKLPLRIFLALTSTIAYQKSIYEWATNHRIHHKYSETDADPHNAKRGFFFAHLGWILVKKHPDVINKGKTIDVSDLLGDPVVWYQNKFYTPLGELLCFVLPTVIPMMLWDESFVNSFFIPAVLRLIIGIHQASTVNSVGHLWGNRPYDRNINPTDNIWAIFGTFGEGFHNYHHTFPWDYAASEYGTRYNTITVFIDLMAWLGLAYDLRTVSRKVIRERKLRTGDGSIHSKKDEAQFTY